MDYITNNILGKPEVVGEIKSISPMPKNSLLGENPNCNFVADIMKNELNTDIALINSGNMRASFEVGHLSTRDITALAPLNNKMCIIKMTEKELIDALKVGAKSTLEQDSSPGILQVSGLRYKMNKSGELTEIKFIDKDGKENLIDVNNPNVFKTYTVALDDFVAKGGNNYMTNHWDNAIAKYDFDKDKLVIDYLKKFNTPIEIKTDGRIQIS